MQLSSYFPSTLLSWVRDGGGGGCVGGEAGECSYSSHTVVVGCPLICSGLVWGWSSPESIGLDVSVVLVFCILYLA